MANWQVGAISSLYQSGHSYAALGTDIYAAGDYYNSPALVQAYRTSTNRWEQRQSMPVGISDGAMESDGQYLYYFGGITSSGNFAISVYRYNPTSNSWSTAGETVRRFANMGATRVDNLIYLIGGLHEEDVSVGQEVEIYDPSTQRSSLFGTRLSQSRTHTACVAVGSNIYIIGGRVLTESNDSVSTTNSALVEVLDVTNGSIKTLSNAPVSGQVYACYIDGEIHCVSGYQFYIYNIEDNSWRYGDTLSSAYGTRAGIFAFDYLTYVMPANTGAGPVLYADNRFVEVVNAQPSSGFVNEKVANTFSWELQSTTSTVQQSAVYQWRVNGSTVTTSINVTGSDTFVVVPANTFPDGKVDWRVMVTTTDGISSDWTPWYTIFTEDQPHTRPTNLYPSDGKIVNATQSIQLSWVVNAPLNTPQTAFEVQIAYDDAKSWINLSGKITSEASTFLVPGNTFQPDETGRVFWRVRTYNTDDQAGEWSNEVSIIARKAPDPPQWVSVEIGKARPLAVWYVATNDQTSYQLRVYRGEEILYDTGELPGADNEHKIKDYLPNGSYVFSVRARNDINLWSEWSDRNVVISFPQLYNIRLDGEQQGDGIHLEFEVRVR